MEQPTPFQPLTLGQDNGVDHMNYAILAGNVGLDHGRFIMTLPSAVLMDTFEPCVVFASFNLTTSAAITLPGTTW